MYGGSFLGGWRASRVAGVLKCGRRADVIFGFDWRNPGKIRASRKEITGRTGERVH
jgi:hypothetical protein